MNEAESSPLSIPDIARAVEAVLFVADTPVAIERLLDVVGCSKRSLMVALDGLELSLQGGVRLQRHADHVQLVTAPDLAVVVERFLGLDAGAKLSTAAVESLAVIAYRQPVTRAQVEAIRGVNSDRAVATLQARGLIEEVGRLEAAGRPTLFGTTVEFLEHFGLSGLPELPPLPGLPGDEATDLFVRDEPVSPLDQTDQSGTNESALNTEPTGREP